MKLYKYEFRENGKDIVYKIRPTTTGRKRYLFLTDVNWWDC